MSQPDPTTIAADEVAVQAVIGHHAQLAAGLTERVEALVRRVETDQLRTAQTAREDLLAFLRREVLPHARAEEQALYPPAAAHPDGRLLVEGMLAEHAALTALVEELAAASSPVRAATAARALAALFAVHLAKENDLVLPLLVTTPGVSVAGVLSGMHDLLGAAAGHHEPTGAAPPPGEAVVLIAPHAPRPVLAEVDQRFGRQVRSQWLQSGPDVWQVRLERVTRSTAGKDTAAHV